MPDAPSASALRAKSTAAFDEQGRDYQDKTYSVDPSTGSVSTNALTTNRWFDPRGLVIKTAQPGGLVVKDLYDGAGRQTTEYTTDGGGDSGYSDAATVTGDAVLEQVETAYDGDSNATLTTIRERFHDETETGALGTPSTGVHARVSYTANYFDAADRLTDSADVGTNGGSAYTRPSTVPSRSDSTLVTSYGYNAAGWVSDTTDPRGLFSKTYYNLAGWVTKTVENYVDGTVSDADDKTVEYGYNGLGDVATLTADLTGGGHQTTENVFVVSTSGGLVSNDLVGAVRHPDKSTGNSSASEQDSYTYNQLGQVLTFTDRNGTVHTYTYDVLGRVTVDAITTLGTGVDGAVRRIEYAYDGQGNLYLVTSYDAASGGNIVNQVQRAFNGLGQLIQEWQATSGAVNTGTTPSVQYAYSFAPSGTTNHSRLTSIAYPNGRVVTYNYASGLSDAISRLSSITDGATTLESYQYLGLGTVVTRAHSQTGVDLTYVKLTGESDGAAGDKYTGLDAFGRVIDQRWTTSAGAAADRRQYGYDRDSNRLYALNAVNTARSELYAFDGLNQLASFQRGTLNGTRDGLTGSASRSQSWDFDALGNFDSQTTDGTTQTRTANKQNEITSISGAITPTYDAIGTMTGDETGKQLVYDGWGRLVAVKNSGGTTLATYRYDGLHRRVRDIEAATTDFYSDQWQVLEARVGGNPSASYVWSPVYVDALIARDRDTDGNGTLDERLYALQDPNWNVVGLVNTSGTVVERYQYDAYGTQTVMDGGWNTRTGSNYAFPLGFQGLRYDAAASGYNARNREEDPSLGRFTAADPLGFAAGDVDFYRDEGNGPEALLDPFGLQGGGGWGTPPGTGTVPPAFPTPGNPGHAPPLDLALGGGPKPTNPWMRPVETPELPRSHERPISSRRPWDPPERLPAEDYQWHATHYTDEEFAKACRLREIDERLRSPFCNETEAFLLIVEARSLQGGWGEGALLVGSKVLMDIGSGVAGAGARTAIGSRSGSRGVRLPGPVQNPGRLTFDPATQSWRSNGGLVYGQGSVHGNRVKHVLEHLSPDPSKPLHTWFTIPANQFIGLLDEAWAARQGAGVLQANGNRFFDIPMGRVVGACGETKIRIFVRDGTTNVITAFPVP